MNIRKRDGRVVDFDREKISTAIKKSYIGIMKPFEDSYIDKITDKIVEKVEDLYKDTIPTVEQIQDLVELELIEEKEIDVVKSYITYRAAHSKDRQVLRGFNEYLEDDTLVSIIRDVRNDYSRDLYPIESLFHKFSSFCKKDMSGADSRAMLIRAASELTTKEAPDWEYIASRFYRYDLELKINENYKGIDTFYEKIKNLTEMNLYGKYILENYTKEDIDKLEKELVPERDKLLTYSSIDLLAKRYLVRSHDMKVLERPQEMFMGIAMHLALPEGKNKVEWATRIYTVLSKLQVTVATPTMNNARKPFYQLSSCFIDTVPDTLEGIYRSIDNFAQVSKHGGGMGLYFGKVRSSGSDIRGFKGVAGGVIRWLRLVNDTAVAVDQLGVRQGSCAVYLDAWHKDLPEFLQIRTNNGDDRMKAHDIFPAVSYPDLFFRLAKNNIDADWYMFDPHEIMVKKGYCLEDYYGDEFEKKYYECVHDANISKRVISVKDMVRLIIKSLTETGTPFAFFRDAVNKMNPNKHKGMIYSSNLCTEIMQNMSAIETVSQEIETEEGDTVVVTKTKPGDFVVCNLASLVISNINLEDDEEVEYVVSTAVRGLDNVIDLNYYPLPYAKITNSKYRAIGLGTSGYHHALIKEGIAFSDEEEHLEFADRVYEKLNYYAVKASNEIAKEKGAYEYFKGSDWDNGDYFELRGYHGKEWEDLRASIHEHGMRNGYIMAVAPTGSTSIIAGTTAAVDPVMKRFFLEEKKGAIIPRVAPDLNTRTFWLYEQAHEIDQSLIIKATGVRGRHIDQGQSVNLYITSDFTMRQILNLYIRAMEEGLKSLYYVRSKSLEVDECEVCQA